ncbi:MAG: hypothetical protein WD737_05945 [Gemmatimonadota bacterium]
MSSPRDADGGDGNTRRPIKRKQVSPERLLRLLNQRLEGYGHCHACRFVGPIRGLSEVAEDGRNWSRYVALVCSDGVGSGCKRIAERILDDAALEYNLRTPL